MFKGDSLKEFKKLDNEASLKIHKSQKRSVHLPLVSIKGKETNICANPKMKGCLEASFNVQGKDTLDCEIARMFYFSVYHFI